MVLPFVGLQVPAGSDCPLSCLYYICRFDFLNSTVLRLVCYLQALMNLDCPPTHLYCNRTTMGLVYTKGIDKNRSTPL